MDDRNMPTHEEQVARVTDARTRMDERARMWLEDKKVKRVLDAAATSDCDVRQAG
jgi:hypothetical protein